jgi:hypothetical protein
MAGPGGLLRQCVSCGLCALGVLVTALAAPGLAKDPPDPDPRKDVPAVDSNYSNATASLTVPFRVTRDANNRIVLVRPSSSAPVINITYADRGDQQAEAPIFLKLDMTYKTIPFALTTPDSTPPAGNKFAVDVGKVMDQVLAAISPLLDPRLDPVALTVDPLAAKLTAVPVAPAASRYLVPKGTQDPREVKGNPVAITFKLVLVDPPAAAK